MSGVADSGGATVAELTGQTQTEDSTDDSRTTGQASHSFIPIPRHQRFRTDRDDAIKPFDVSPTAESPGPSRGERAWWGSAFRELIW